MVIVWPYRSCDVTTLCIPEPPRYWKPLDGQVRYWSLTSLYVTQMISDTVRRVSANQFIHGEGRALLHGFVCRRFLLHARCVILPVCVSVCVCVWSAASINRLRPCEPTCGTAVHSVHWTELRVGLFLWRRVRSNDDNSPNVKYSIILWTVQELKESWQH